MLVPKGALVSGRLRRLEKYTDESPYFVVGLEFSEVNFPGNRARFFAELEQITSPAGLARIAKMPTPHLPILGTSLLREAGVVSRQVCGWSGRQRITARRILPKDRLHRGLTKPVKLSGFENLAL